MQKERINKTMKQDNKSKWEIRIEKARSWRNRERDRKINWRRR